MNTALIVFAHESKDSFSAAAKNEAETELKGQGLEVLVSDLHAMKFKLTATAKDIVGKTDAVRATLDAVFVERRLLEFLLSLQVTLRKKSSTMQMPPRKRGATGSWLKKLLMSRAN